MKKIKTVVLIFSVFILSGCTATYDLVLNEDGDLQDKLVIKSDMLSSTNTSLYTKHPMPTSLDVGCVLDYDTYDLENAEEKQENIDYYDVKYDNDNKMLSFESKNSIDLYQNTRIANLLFNNIHVNNYNDMISIYGYNGLIAFLSYPELEQVIVNIKTLGNVVSHNADKVIGNKYTWYFDKNTSDTKDLYLEIKKEDEKNVVETKKTGINSSYVLIGVFFALIIAIVIMKIYQSRKEK